MKSGALATAIVLYGALAGVALGHPLNAPRKRAIKTEVVVVTQTVAEAVVYVDQDGVPYSTSAIDQTSSMASATVEATPDVSSSSIETTEVQLLATPSPQSTVTPSPSNNPTSSSSDLVSAPPVTSAAPSLSLPESYSSTTTPPPAPSSQAPAPSANAAQPPPASDVSPMASDDDQLPLGITYDPFKGVPGQCQCKTADEMAAEFEKMKDFGIMRIYGNDCGVIPVAVQEAKKNGQKVMGGIYTPNQDVNTVVKALSDAVNKYNGGNWDIIRLVSVENERVNAHVMTASDAQDSLSQARQALSSAGYSGPVGVVETAPAIIDNPSLCDKSDMTLVNIHAFFDANTKAEDAGKFVRNEVARVKQACPNKRVVVTESGWPHNGTSHDQAIVSQDAQDAAIKSLRAAFNNDLFLFNAFDSLWKTDDDATWNAEKYWGIL